MKKNITRFAALVSVVTLFAFASCQKEENGGEALFTATIESADSHKTAINITDNGGEMSWVSDDQITIFGTGSDDDYTAFTGIDFVATPGSNPKEATFSRAQSSDPVPVGHFHAIYPAEITVAHNKITLGDQTYSATSFAAPMYAESDDNNLAFKNVCGVFRIILNESASRTVSSIVVSTPSRGGVTISGDFPVSMVSEQPVLRLNGVENGGHSLTLHCNNAPGNGTFFIYLPPATYEARNLTITVNYSDGYILEKNLTQNCTIKRNKFYTLNIPPQGTKGGLFSVSANKKVWFSQGNLQYIGSTTTPYWKFADNQWDYFGTMTGQNSDNQTVDRDLFGWGTGNNPTLATTEFIDYYGDFVDWSSNAISNGGNTANSGWHTLSSTEWNYLFNTRTTNTSLGTETRYAKGQVNDVYGVILFPDGYTHPTNVDPPEDINDPEDAGWDDNYYDSEVWALMEAAGAVFLPAAGYRWGSEVCDWGTCGAYWSSTPQTGYLGYAYEVDFNLDCLFIQSAGRPNGCSVRLVRDKN